MKEAEASIRSLKEIERPTNMANYKIIGADRMEYGPVSAEQIRQWITERRVDSETKLQAEGGSEWKRLAEVPEFAEPSPRSGPSTCPNCGETFEDRLDSCWKCGTRRDGSRLKQWTPVDDAKEAAEQDEPCPKCGSSNVRRGKLLPVGRGSSVMFKPEGTRFSVGPFRAEWTCPQTAVLPVWIADWFGITCGPTN